MIGTQGKVRHLLVEVERLLHKQRGARRLKLDQRGLLAAPLEAQASETHPSQTAARKLLRLLQIGSEFRRRSWKHQAELAAGKSNSTFSRMRPTSSGMPSLVLQLVKTNGFLPRISFESWSITSRSAPT